MKIEEALLSFLRESALPASRSVALKVDVGLSPVSVYRGASARALRCVFGALAAAGRGGGRHVERRKSTDSKVPIGTTESSPRFQPLSLPTSFSRFF